jgi:hypothetical protein
MQALTLTVKANKSLVLVHSGHFISGAGNIKKEYPDNGYKGKNSKQDHDNEERIVHDEIT